MIENEVLGRRRPSFRVGARVLRAQYGGVRFVTALRGRRGRNEVGRGSGETRQAARDQGAVGLVAAAGLGFGLVRRTVILPVGVMPVGMLSGCSVGAVGKRVELLVVVAAEVRVSVQPLQTFKQVAVPGLSFSETQGTPHADQQEQRCEAAGDRASGRSMGSS